MEFGKYKKFMVEFAVPHVFTQDMSDTIPEQQKAVDEYFLEGKLLSYTLAKDRHKLWAIFVSPSEDKLIVLIDNLPMTKFLKYDYHEVLFHEMVSLIPALSLN
jgi:hypothetical protein